MFSSGDARVLCKLSRKCGRYPFLKRFSATLSLLRASQLVAIILARATAPMLRRFAHSCVPTPSSMPATERREWQRQ